MTWEPIPSDERAKLRLDIEGSVLRVACECGCMKFAVIIESGADYKGTQWQLV